MDIGAYYAKRAKYYDIINAHKFREVGEEMRFFRRELLKRSKNAKTILDVGCGTGRLSIPLSRAGFKVTGIDNSREMLAIAKKKISASSGNPRFELADLRTYRSATKFDCAVCGDASLATFMSKADLIRAMRNISANMKPGGVFFYDVWNYAEYWGWVSVSRRTAKGEGIVVSIVRRTNVDSRGVYRFTDRMSIIDKGKPSQLSMTYTSKVWRYRDWLDIFKLAGFRAVKCYSNLSHITHFKGVPDRLYFVAQK